MPYANNKGADQPAHPRSLSSAFIIRWLDSIILVLAQYTISRFYLVSVGEQACFSLIRSETRRQVFSGRGSISTFDYSIIVKFGKCSCKRGALGQFEGVAGDS